MGGQCVWSCSEDIERKEKIVVSNEKRQVIGDKTKILSGEEITDKKEVKYRVKNGVQREAQKR